VNTLFHSPLSLTDALKYSGTLALVNVKVVFSFQNWLNGTCNLPQVGSITVVEDDFPPGKRI
jgi:hypothetical protein